MQFDLRKSLQLTERTLAIILASKLRCVGQENFQRVLINSRTLAAYSY
jgi:hypothetical protein